MYRNNKAVKISNIKPIGSLRIEIAKEYLLKNKKKIKLYDICFISEASFQIRVLGPQVFTIMSMHIKHKLGYYNFFYFSLKKKKKNYYFLEELVVFKTEKTIKKKKFYIISIKTKIKILTLNFLIRQNLKILSIYFKVK